MMTLQLYEITLIGTLPYRYQLTEANAAITLIEARHFGAKFLGPISYSYSGYYFNKDWLNKNEDTALRFIGTLYRVADVLSGPDTDKALEIMRVHLNKASNSNFTLKQAHDINTNINPWFTMEQAKKILFTPGEKTYWNDRLKWIINCNIEKGNLKEGDVIVENHSQGEYLFSKLWGYKTKCEKDMITIAKAYNENKVKNKNKIRSLIEQANLNWLIRNYIDAAKLANEAKILINL
jgi:hypothetical protein